MLCFQAHPILSDLPESSLCTERPLGADHGPLSARHRRLRCKLAGIHAALDHRTLNDLAGLDTPTSERLAMWLWQRLKPELPGLSQVKVMETHDSGCIYRG